MSPVGEISNNLAGETYVTASAIHPVINNNKNKWNEISVNGNVTQLKDKMYKKIVILCFFRILFMIIIND